MKKIVIPLSPVSPVLPPRRFDITRLEHPHAIEGETMKRCPKCRCDRQRSSSVEGPFFLKDLPPESKRLQPRRSNKIFWKIFWGVTLLWWFVLPPSKDNGKVWYKITPFAKCNTPGCRHRGRPEEVTERKGIRKLSLLKRAEHRIRHHFEWNIKCIAASR